jgi:hypothetical protein
VGSVLHAEATIHEADDFRVYCPKEGDPEGERAWPAVRRGVADFNRRAGVARNGVERYLDGLASEEEDTALEEWIASLA